MIDLGDIQRLSVVITDANGAPANAGAVVLTITLPDASTATPVVTNDGPGLYSANFTTTQAGRHAVRWVATGANAGAYTDVFQVDAADPGLIISLAQARSAIGTPSTVTTKDEDLRGYIAAATPIMEDLIGAILPRPLDEWYDGGWRTVRLMEAPLISVTTVTESIGVLRRTLTAQPLDGATFDAYGYTVDLVDGILTRRAAGSDIYFAPGRRNVHVVYTAGRPGGLKGNVLLATRRLIRHFWQQEQNAAGRPDMGGSAEPTVMTTTPAGYAVPRVCVELCAGQLRPVGIG